MNTSKPVITSVVRHDAAHWADTRATLTTTALLRRVKDSARDSLSPDGGKARREEAAEFEAMVEEMQDAYWAEFEANDLPPLYCS